MLEAAHRLERAATIGVHYAAAILQRADKNKHGLENDAHFHPLIINSHAKITSPVGFSNTNNKQKKLKSNKNKQKTHMHRHYKTNLKYITLKSNLN